MKNFYLSVAFLAFTGFLSAQEARVQVIHNSADTSARTVDVYLNDTRVLDNLQFRRASGFVNIPAGTEVAIGVAPGNSTSVQDTVARFNFTLEEDKRYVIVANGIVSANGYTPMQKFVLSVFDMGREEATDPAKTDVLVMHGSTDAPSVDIVERTEGMLVENISYGEFSDDYLELPTANYTLDVKPTGTTTPVASFSAPLQTLNLQGKSIVVLASGFLNPAANSNGAPFGLWVALPSGGELVQLQSVPTSIAEQKANDLKIWPNPSSDRINFTLKSGTENATVEITNLSGQVVRSIQQKNIQNNVNQVVDISNLSPGIYIFSIKTPNEVITKKITKF
jgi:hypothetical protein